MQTSPCAERCLAELIQEPPETSFPFMRELECWERLLQRTTGIGPFDGSLLNSLSRAEYVSLCLLREWMYSYPLNSVSFIFHTIGLKRHDVDWPDTAVPHPFDLKIYGVFYHKAMSDLFVHEFMPEKFSKRELSSLRRHAASLTSTHLLASKFCKEMLPTLPDTISEGLLRSILTKPQIQNARDFEITATLEACPWLSPEECQDQPYYLWDLNSRRTVMTAEIGHKPYSCISHTWGRWVRTNDENQPLKVNIDGVPWPVPLNDRFDVQKLPDLLQAAVLSADYVWLDLLCIPQCGYQKDIMQMEIAKQAAIFKNARLVGAWLNDIETWEDVKSALLWLSLQYFQSTSWEEGFPRKKELSKVMNPVQREALDRHLDLKVLDHNANYFALIKNLGNQSPSWSDWFSSLWTLQEFCLRPDMVLFDKSWRSLEVLGQNVHLDDFAAFIDFVSTTMIIPEKFERLRDGFLKTSDKSSEWDQKFRSPKEDDFLFGDFDIAHLWPAGPAKLVDLNLTTNISRTFQRPSMILHQGDSRQCSGRRAEAIMSVLGATSWYSEYMKSATDTSGQMSTELGLVLDKYPVEFLNEVVQKYGSEFFASRITSRKSALAVQESFTKFIKPMGSLLPFSGTVGFSGFEVSPVIDLDLFIDSNHPSVRLWTVQRDATVRVSEVGVMACSKTPGYGSPWSVLILDAPLLFNEQQHVTDEIEFSNIIPADVNVYLVCLGDNMVNNCGIVLQQLSSSSEREELEVMVKVGLWYSIGPGIRKTLKTSIAYEDSLVPTTRVKWIVL